MKVPDTFFENEIAQNLMKKIMLDRVAKFKAERAGL